MNVLNKNIMKLGKLQKKWIKTLKEHPERQTTGRLGIIDGGEHKMCCLGQGGVIAGVCRWEGERLVTPTGVGYKLSDVYESIGLRNAYGEALSTADGMPDLADMNDGGMSWPEIAVIMETFPEEYFTKSV